MGIIIRPGDVHTHQRMTAGNLSRYGPGGTAGVDMKLINYKGCTRPHHFSTLRTRPLLDRRRQLGRWLILGGACVVLLRRFATSLFLGRF